MFGVRLDFCCGGRGAGRSEFGRRAEPERSEGGGARRSQTARAWPRAAQHLFYPKSTDEPFVIDT